MRTGDENLSPQQRELVAVGASVGAGCHPCVSHHIKAATNAGVSGERLLAALASSKRVAAEAAARMTVHARGQLGAEVTTPAAASPLDDALASLGSALAANDVANIENHMRAATELGASRPQIQDAIATAQKVQENATRIHVREAERLLERSTTPGAPVTEPDAGCDDGCPCHEGDSLEEASVASEPATDPTGTADGGCAQATCNANTDGPLGTMAGYAAMFKSTCAQLAAAHGVEEPSTPIATVTNPPRTIDHPLRTRWIQTALNTYGLRLRLRLRPAVQRCASPAQRVQAEAAGRPRRSAPLDAPSARATVRSVQDSCSAVLTRLRATQVLRRTRRM